MVVGPTKDIFYYDFRRLYKPQLQGCQNCTYERILLFNYNVTPMMLAEIIANSSDTTGPCTIVATTENSNARNEGANTIKRQSNTPSINASNAANDSLLMTIVS